MIRTDSNEFAQSVVDVWKYSGALTANGSSSGSVSCVGYKNLVGLFCSDASTQTASGLQVQWSCDKGSHWDKTTASDAFAACAVGACLTTVLGDAVKVTWRNGADAASQARLYFYLQAN